MSPLLSRPTMRELLAEATRLALHNRYRRALRSTLAAAEAAGPKDLAYGAAPCPATTSTPQRSHHATATVSLREQPDWPSEEALRPFLFRLCRLAVHIRSGLVDAADFRRAQAELCLLPLPIDEFSRAVTRLENAWHYLDADEPEMAISELRLLSHLLTEHRHPTAGAN
ncbi:MAG TPA: hypothetical protein VKD72_21465 [Gemmataceae bacterium]|nr:hypothetical protein [Gemmataceae bacterium]